MRYFVLLLLAGCASEGETQYRWAKPGSDRQAYEMESSQCEQAALTATKEVERGVSIFGACMRGKGWTLVER